MLNKIFLSIDILQAHYFREKKTLFKLDLKLSYPPTLMYIYTSIAVLFVENTMEKENDKQKYEKKNCEQIKRTRKCCCFAGFPFSWHHHDYCLLYRDRPYIRKNRGEEEEEEKENDKIVNELLIIFNYWYSMIDLQSMYRHHWNDDIACYLHHRSVLVEDEMMEGLHCHHHHHRYYSRKEHFVRQYDYLFAMMKN